MRVRSAGPMLSGREANADCHLWLFSPEARKGVILPLGLGRTGWDLMGRANISRGLFCLNGQTPSSLRMCVLLLR